MNAPFAGIPFLRRTEDAIPAATWNLWRRWRKRYGEPLEFPLEARPGTKVLITDECWLYYDATQGGMPLILWLEFRRDRDALHADVPCYVQYYDYPGARFRDAVLREAAERMECDLAR